ncbi:MAG TPA: pilin [Candidatus Paceibacterota bacterium]
MRRLAAWLPLFLAMIALGVPHLASADVSSLSTGFSIVPDACNCGAGAGWGCVLLVIGNLLNLAIGIGVLASVAALAYAGFLWVTNPLNSENRTQGRTMLMNAVIGLVIALGAWLIVNTLLTVLTGSGVESATSKLGIGSNCLPTASDITSDLNVSNNSSGSTVGYSGTPVNGAPNVRGECTPDALALNGMDSSITSTMSCITKTEDASCALGAKSGTDLSDNGAGPSVSIGMFQVNISANNLSQYPACEAAVNNAPLNCTAAFTGGAYTASNHSTHLVNQNLYNTCVTAASNAKCSAQVAQDLYQNHGGSKNWGTAAQQNCGG